MVAYEVEEVEPEEGRRVFHVLDAAKVAPPPPGRKRGRAPAKASRYYQAWRRGLLVFVQRSPGGEVRMVDPARGCSCPAGMLRRPCPHRVIAGVLQCIGEAG